MSLQVADIQALRIGWEDTNFRLNIGATATSRATASRITALSSDVGYHLRVGGNAATTDFFVPGNVIVFAITDNQPVGCITATGGNGTLYLSESV